jgi:hypothetical protein
VTKFTGGQSPHKSETVLSNLLASRALSNFDINFKKNIIILIPFLLSLSVLPPLVYLTSPTTNKLPFLLLTLKTNKVYSSYNTAITANKRSTQQGKKNRGSEGNNYNKTKTNKKFH